jgi:hypothetical protein
VRGFEVEVDGHDDDDDDDGGSAAKYDARTRFR